MVLENKPKNCAYMRISVKGENLENQKEAIKRFAKEELIFFQDIEHGDSKTKDRPGFNQLMNYIHTFRAMGNQIPNKLYVFEISRIGRDHLETLTSVIELEKNDNVQVLSASPNESWINITNHTIRGLILSIMSWQYEQELMSLRSRTKEALSIKKEQLEKNGYFISRKGKTITKLGRPERVIDWEKYEKLRKEGYTISVICRMLGYHYPWFIKKKKEHEILAKE